MPRCSKCGKKFKTLSALNDHFRAIHPNQKFVAPQSAASRNLMVGIVIVIIALGVVGYLVVTQPPKNNGSTTVSQPSILNQPISSPLYSDLTGVSYSTLSTVGKGTTDNSFQSVSGNPLTSQGKPEVLYMGAEYCPFCAAERWSLVVALSKFGTFSNLEYMLSGPNDQNLSTVTFVNANYQSSYISFVAVEQEDRLGNALQTPTQAESTLMSQYDSSTSIPFVDIANSYTLVGAQYTTSTISNLNWTQIGSQLNNPGSNVAKAIDGAANAIITEICRVDGAQPSTLCNQSFATLSLAIPAPALFPPLIVNSVQVNYAASQSIVYGGGRMVF